MTTTAPITPRTGDVILVEQDGDPISKLIARFTNSPFSHSIVVLDETTFADANPVQDPVPDEPHRPDAGADIEIFGLDELEKFRQTVKRFVLYRPDDQHADPDLLRHAVDVLEQASRGPDFKTRFSDGAVCGLWILRTLESVGRIAAQNQLHAATDGLFWALEDGSGRLFCSEFAFRVLDAAGQRPATPKIPTVPTPGFPTDDPPDSAVSWFDRLIGFLEMRWRALCAEFGLDEWSWRTFQEVVGRWRYAFEHGLRPGKLERANYFTPADFAQSPSMHTVAQQTKSDSDWVPIPAAGS